MCVLCVCLHIYMRVYVCMYVWNFYHFRLDNVKLTRRNTDILYIYIYTYTYTFFSISWHDSPMKIMHVLLSNTTTLMINLTRVLRTRLAVKFVCSLFLLREIFRSFLKLFPQENTPFYFCPELYASSTWPFLRCFNPFLFFLIQFVLLSSLLKVYATGRIKSRVIARN